MVVTPARRRLFATSFTAVLLAAALTPGCSAPPVHVTQSQARTLIPTRFLEGWRNPTGDWMNVGSVKLNYDQPKSLEISDTRATGVLVNGYGGKTVDLVSEAEFGDVEVHIEYMVAKGSNSGVYLMGRYELQILDSFGKPELGVHDNAAIYQRWDPSRGKGNEGYEGRTPPVNASKHPGQWQSFDIIFRAPRFDETGNKIGNARFVKVFHNGVLIHENVDLTGPTRGGWEGEKPTGPLRLQGDHGPVAFRNILVREFNVQRKTN